MNRDAMKTIPPDPSKRHWSPSECPLAFGAVQWALELTYHEHMETTHFVMITGRPAMAMSGFTREDDDGWTVLFEQMQDGGAGAGREQKDICCDMVKRLREHREFAQELSGRGHLSVL